MARAGLLQDIEAAGGAPLASSLQENTPVPEETSQPAPEITITVSGSIGGYPATMPINAPDNDGLGDFLQGLPDYLASIGFAAPRAAPAPQQRQPEPQQQPAQSYQPQQQHGGGDGASWQTCGHGDQFIRPGYNGNGQECGYSEEQPFPTAKDRPSTMRDGRTLFYCRVKSQQGGGGQRGGGWSNGGQQRQQFNGYGGNGRGGGNTGGGNNANYAYGNGN